MRWSWCKGLTHCPVNAEMTVQFRRPPQYKTSFELLVSSSADFKLETRNSELETFFRNCGREVRHLVVNQADDGSSPFSSAIVIADCQLLIADWPVDQRELERSPIGPPATAWWY